MTEVQRPQGIRHCSPTRAHPLCACQCSALPAWRVQYVWTNLGNSKDRPDLLDSVLIAEFDCKTTEEHTELCEKCVLGAARWCPPISTRNRRSQRRRRPPPHHRRLHFDVRLLQVLQVLLLQQAPPQQGLSGVSWRSWRMAAPADTCRQPTRCPKLLSFPRYALSPVPGACQHGTLQ